MILLISLVIVLLASCGFCLVSWKLWGSYQKSAWFCLVAGSLVFAFLPLLFVLFRLQKKALQTKDELIVIRKIPQQTKTTKLPPIGAHRLNTHQPWDLKFQNRGDPESKTGQPVPKKTKKVVLY